MFKNKSLKYKLYFGFSIILAGLLFVGSFGIYKFNQSNENIHLVKTKQFEPILQSSEILENLLTWNRILLNHILINDMADKTDSEKRREKLEDEIVKKFKFNINSEIRTDEDRKLLSESLELFTTSINNAKTVISLSRELKINEASKLQIASVRPNINKSVEKTKEFLKLINSQYLKNMERLDEDYKTSLVLISLLVLITLAIGVFFAIFLSKSISTPIEEAIVSLTKKSENILSSSEQLSSASQSLASSTNQQASAVEETSASMEEIGGMVTNNLRAAENSETASNKVYEKIGNLENAMIDIVKSNEKIEYLNKIISEIGDKTKVIDEIVFQTKLLSFNASVEAERAGEYGRGFAVVAQEVGNLAQMSGKSALEISAIVKNSLKQTEEVIRQNAEKVNLGNRYVIEVKKDTTEVLNHIKHIVIASKEQATGIDHINTALSQISKTTQVNAQASEETSASSDSLKEEASSLEETVENLKKLIYGQ